jgi:RNA polymerase sigma-70 factor (ECF subfamily)
VSSAESPKRTTFIDYIDNLYGYAFTLSLNTAHAERLVKNTYLQAAREVEQFGTDTVKTWLFTILRSIWRDDLKRQNLAFSTVETESKEETANAIVGHCDENSPRNGRSPLDVRLFQQLPREFREAILLRDYEEFSTREIACILTLPIETVRAVLTSARTELQTRLARADYRPLA